MTSSEIERNNRDIHSLRKIRKIWTRIKLVDGEQTTVLVEYILVEACTMIGTVALDVSSLSLSKGSQAYFVCFDFSRTDVL